jgi:hypothetical protein
MNSAEKQYQQFLKEFERLLRHSRLGGDLEAAATMEEWERTIESAPEPSRELLRELARFADLWCFLSEGEQDLGESVVAEICALHALLPSQRLVRLQQINRTLMSRVKNAGHGSQLRH